MSKKLPYTPNSKIRQALRVLFLRSRERNAALKAYDYCCSECGVKQSKAKGKECALQVHHAEPINWDGIFDFIRARLLNVPMVPLCEKCHAKETEKQARQQKKDAVLPIESTV